MKSFLFVAALSALVLAACGGRAAPTVDPGQIQASAVAAASTMVALTQAAIPTPSPEPPTALPNPTELPSPTLLALPTLDTSGFPTAAPAPTIASGTSTTDCNHPLDVGSAGPKHNTVIINASDGTFNISLNLYQTNSFGQCGAISISNVGKSDRISVGLPSGYWFAYAWVTLKKGGSSTSEGSFYVKPAESTTADLCVHNDTIVYKYSC